MPTVGWFTRRQLLWNHWIRPVKADWLDTAVGALQTRTYFVNPRNANECGVFGG